LRKPRRSHGGLVTAGVITFGVSWGVGATVSFIYATDSGSCSTFCNDAQDYLWIPVAGPLLFARSDSGSDWTGIFILWGAAEAAGLTMLIAGLLTRDAPAVQVGERGPTLRLAPMLARGTGGLALTASW
jgi:hypothetical protein